ncbi:MAG: hypothetical protein IJ064_01455 [Bacteroidaceae bacterium]|nr:hypothetical protein [Bacteroidaceae bacterium]
MKRYTHWWLLALCLPLFISSCSDDEAVALPSENCYISSFTLGSLQRTIYGLTLAGNDSIYTSVFSGGAYPMTIDQRTGLIQNTDSLPVRTRVDRVLTTVVFDGVLAWRRADISQLEDTTWTTYSSADSLDLTSPLHFRVYAASGNSSRTYTVQLNVHQQDGDSTVWNRVPTASPLTGMGARKAVVWGGQLNILALDATGALCCVSRPLDTVGDWTTDIATGATQADPTTLQVQGDTLFLSTTDGRVLSSTDARTWATAPYTTRTGLRLVAASNSRLYALADGKMWSSAGGDWTEETLDSEPDCLPVDQLQSVSYTLRNGTPRVLLVGRRQPTDDYATLWAKAWEGEGETAAPWQYYVPNGADKFRCPMLENLCILPYDGGLQALGGRSRNGDFVAMADILHSADHGITWKKYEEDDMKVDPDLRAAAQTADYLTAAVDADNYLWVVVDTEVWRGRINRLGFLKN